MRIGVCHKTGIESTFMMTPMFRYRKNDIIEFFDSDRGRELADIFVGMGQPTFVETPISLEESIELYGDKEKYNPRIHICKMYVDTFKCGHDNYIPWMDFSGYEILWAKNFLSKYKNPVCICPFTGQFYRDKDANQHGRMMGLDKWQIIIDALKTTHDVLCFTKKENFTPLNGIIPLFDLSLRQMCALFRISQIYIGLENGMHHAAIASGATTFCFINDDINKFFWPNTLYTDDMWKYERRRVFYYLLNDVENFLKSFGKI